MGIIGGVLNLVSSIASAASTHGGDAPKAETQGNGGEQSVDLGPLKVSVNDKGLKVELDGKEIAKLGDPDGTGDKSGAGSKPALDLHSKDTFEEPKDKPKVALDDPKPAHKDPKLDKDSGVGSKLGGVVDGQK